MSDPHRRTVLYVEDHPVNALLMAALFERCPQLELVIATTGAEALSMAADLRPVLLLLDLGLPDCHGSQLLGRLRVQPGLETVPAVAVTADALFEIAGTSFCELWPKPLNLVHVLARLSALTGMPPTPLRPLREPQVLQSQFGALA
ncbi:response regulator [Roseateles sp. P5_E7]